MSFFFFFNDTRFFLNLIQSAFTECVIYTGKYYRVFFFYLHPIEINTKDRNEKFGYR